MQTVDEALDKLQKSAFRRKFHLSQKDREYVREKGMDVIHSHGEDFIAKRLAPAAIPNDGKQTPMRGHPIFIAQHACACCCRGCLEKWYRVPKGRELSADEQRRIVNLLMRWIEREMNGRQMLPRLNLICTLFTGQSVRRVHINFRRDFLYILQNSLENRNTMQYNLKCICAHTDI